MTHDLLIEAMKELGMDDREIKHRLYMLELLKGTVPLKVSEVIAMSQDELDKVISVCWHDGKYRCDCVGINSVNLETECYDGINLSWCDSDGDPEIYTKSVEDFVDNIGDGEWNYGLYKKL